MTPTYWTLALAQTYGTYGMEVSSEKSKVMVNNRTQQAANSIMLTGQKLEKVDSFKYLGSTLTKNGSSTKEVKTKLRLVASAMTRISVIWKSNSVSFPLKLRGPY